MSTITSPIPCRRLFSADEGASILEVPESRFRSSWRTSGIVTGLSNIDGKGALYSVSSLIRAALYLQLQALFGEQSSVALTIAKNIPEHALHSLLESHEPMFEVSQNGRRYRIELDAAPLERIRQAVGD